MHAGYLDVDADGAEHVDGTVAVGEGQTGEHGQGNADRRTQEPTRRGYR